MSSLQSISSVPVSPHGQPAGWLAVLSLAPGYATPALRLLPGSPGCPALIAGAADCQVIFEGSLHNRAELLRALGAPAPNPSDAELVLRAYRRWGTEAVRRCKGHFALIIWDERGATLTAARDPLGIYPLFYASADRAILVSTAVAPILRHPGVSATLDRAAIAGYLCRQWPGREETLYTAIRRVPAGHLARLSPSRRVERYWSLPLPGVDATWATEDELDGVETLLDQAVARCLGLGPAGIYLSGGLDSVTVAALAADHSRRAALPAPLALSLIFDHPSCNEETVQRAVAGSLGLPHLLRPVGADAGTGGILRAALELSATWPAPLQSIWNPAYMGLAEQAARRGCRVIVTGGGGDEWLTVAPSYAADLMRVGAVGELMRLAQNMRRSYRLPPLALLRSLLWANGARLVIGGLAADTLRRAGPRLRDARRMRNIGRTLRAIPPWLAPDPALRRQVEERAVAGLDLAMEQPAPRSYYFDDMWQFLDHPLTTMEFEELFEAGSRHGVRLLQPFWDADLVELLYRVPPTLLNRHGYNKGLVRELLARRFPGLGFERQRKVFSIDFFKLAIAREAPDAWRSMGGARALAELGIVDLRGLEESLTGGLAHPQLVDVHRAWEVLNLEAWLRPRTL